MNRRHRLSSFVVLVASLVPAIAMAQAPALTPAGSRTIPADTRETFTIDSGILGETRHVFVSLPPSFDRAAASRTYPLLIVTDGEGASATAVVTAARELARHGLIPDLVIAGVENIAGYDERVRDLTPPGLSVSGSSRSEGGDRFLDFLERELMPALDRRFRTRAPRVLVGHSSGGILATYAAATRDTYRLVVALDTPMHLDDYWLAHQMMARAAAADRPPVRYASYNAVYGWSDRTWSALTAAAPSSWILRQVRLDHETHNSMPLHGAYLGLRELFLDYSRKSAPVYPTTSILPYYETLTSKYGAALVPPQPLMHNVVDDLLIEGRGVAAARAFESLLDAYGEPSDAADLRARIDAIANQPEPTETVESFLATPMATAEEAALYLGEWEGETRRGEYGGSRFTLKIGVDNGRVKGVVVWKVSADEELEQAIQYFTVQPDGFTYGFMNGMRPRGMLLYPMKMQNAGEATGTMRWGGVTPPSLEGQRPPVEQIMLRRVR